MLERFASAPRAALATRARMVLVRGAPALLLALLASTDLPAQAGVGYVSAIKQLDKLHGCPKDEGGRAPARDAAWIWRGGTPKAARAGPDESVRLRDSLEVIRKTDVRVRIESTYGSGAFFLAPDLLSCTEAYIDRMARGVRDTTRAHYAIRTMRADDARPDESLYLIVARGAAFVQWDRAPGQPPLVIHAGGKNLLVPGTEVAIVANPSGTAALIYVRSGAVAIVGPPDVRIEAGQLYEVSADRTPERLPNLTHDIAANLEYYSRTVFLPFWRKPTFYIPAGIGTAAAAVALWPDGNTPPGSWRGTIRIPLPF